ncbi:MAG: OsmC family protein [Elusimicrobiota bacterium]|nr:OsmC family protein [Elusimicrobiota bacterium]
MSDMEIVFPGGKKISALWHGFEIKTDQPRTLAAGSAEKVRGQPAGGGGEGSAPTPFDLFLASLGTCAGIFALGFIQSRGLSAEGLKINVSFEQDEATHLLSKAAMRITLPKDFPPKYKDAVIKAAEQCLVKRTMDNPPAFEITAV